MTGGYFADPGCWSETAKKQVSLKESNGIHLYNLQLLPFCKPGIQPQ